MPNDYYDRALGLIRETGGIGKRELTARFIHGRPHDEENRPNVWRLAEALAALVRAGRVSVEIDGSGQFYTPARFVAPNNGGVR